MRLARTRGFNWDSQQDFDQERAALDEGYRNYRREVEEAVDQVLASDAYSPEQKKRCLTAVRADLMQKKQEYREALQEINEAEARQLAEEAGSTCSWFDDPQLLQSNQASDDCWESAAQETVSDGADNEYTYDM